MKEAVKLTAEDLGLSKNESRELARLLKPYIKLAGTFFRTRDKDPRGLVEESWKTWIPSSVKQLLANYITPYEATKNSKPDSLQKMVEYYDPRTGEYDTKIYELALEPGAGIEVYGELGLHPSKLKLVVFDADNWSDEKHAMFMEKYGDRVVYAAKSNKGQRRHYYFKFDGHATNSDVFYFNMEKAGDVRSTDGYICIHTVRTLLELLRVLADKNLPYLKTREFNQLTEKPATLSNNPIHTKNELVLTLEELSEFVPAGAKESVEHTVAIRCPNPDHDDHNPSAFYNTDTGYIGCSNCGRVGYVEEIKRAARGCEIDHEAFDKTQLQQLDDTILDCLDNGNISYIEDTMRRFNETTGVWWYNSGRDSKAETLAGHSRSVGDIGVCRKCLTSHVRDALWDRLKAPGRRVDLDDERHIGVPFYVDGKPMLIERKNSRLMVRKPEQDDYLVDQDFAGSKVGLTSKDIASINDPGSEYDHMLKTMLTGTDKGQWAWSSEVYDYQLYLGACVLNGKDSKKIQWLIGPSGSGKGTLLETYEYILGNDLFTFKECK
ncbi:MAG: hypothetical protein OXE50_15050, partial [Chloroflexi bacterium]|nr:hypothetical protein [Chloroflexota bacterium]